MPKRFQAGHVFKRGKRLPVWCGRWRERTIENGRTINRQRNEVLGLVSKITETEAREILQDRIAHLASGRPAPTPLLRFRDFVEKWEEAILPNYRESTRGFYKGILKRSIIPCFGDWRLQDIQTYHAQKFLTDFGGRYSKSVLKHMRTTFRIIMQTAVDWNYVERNPVAGLRLPRGRAPKQAVVLEPEQIDRLIEALEEPYRAMVAIASRLGLRESEILALKWADFDRPGRILRVARSFYRGSVDVPKTESSAREIPYPKGIEDALSRLEASGKAGEDFLFQAARGRFFSPQRITQKVFRPLAEGLKIPAFTWRSFRRSVASELHKEGVPIKVQQRILGHTNPDMSLLYTEADASQVGRALEDLDRRLCPNRSQVVGQLVN